MTSHHFSANHTKHKHSHSKSNKERIVIDTNIGVKKQNNILQKESYKKEFKHKLKKSSVHKIESFITSYLFITLGVFFIIASLWWLYDSTNTQNGSSWNKFISFLFPKSKTEIEKSDINSPFLWKIYIPYIFGYFLLIIAFVIKRIKYNISKFIVTTATVSFFLINFKILYYNGLWGNYCYPTFYVALFITLFIVITTFISTYIFDVPKLNLIAILGLYISFILIIFYFGLKIYLLMPSVLLVTLVIYFLSLKQNFYSINFWNFIFAWIFISIIWLRKIVAVDSSNYLFSFILFSSLFFILYQIIIILNYNIDQSKKNKLKNILILSLNIVLVYSMSIFALKKSEEYHNYQFLFSLIIVLVNIIFLYFIVKNKIKIYSTYLYYSTFFLLSITVALIFNSNFIIIFSTISSIFFIIYSRKTRDQIAMFISLSLASVMFIIFLINWIFIYLPVSFSGILISNKDILARGLISGIFVLSVLFTYNQILKKLYMSLSDDWFKRETIRLYIRLFTIFSLYLVLFFAFQYLFLSLSISILSLDKIEQLKQLKQISALSWYIFNCIFLIIIIYLAGRKARTLYIISILLFVISSILLYPLYVHYNIREIRNAFSGNYSLFISGFGLHYVAVFLTLYLLLVIYRRIKRKFSGNKIIFRVYYTFTCLIFVFFVLSEYDHLIFIFNKGEISEQKLVEINSHLPYSILLILSSFSILSIAFVKRFRFLRIIGISIFSIALIKILFFDSEVLTNTSKILISFLLGSVLLILSLNYSKLKKLF